jgi:hypothetical protein
MPKYTVELSSSAEKTYIAIRKSANNRIEVGDSSNPKVTILQTVDELIDKVISRSPFEVGKGLCHPLINVYWIAREGLHIFYAASAKSQTIVILSIWDTPKNETRLRDADAIFKQMVRSGQLDHLLVQFGLRVVSSGVRVQPPAVN